MKIIFLNPVASLGGAERSLQEIFKCLREKKPDWQIGLICADFGPLIDFANNYGIKSFVLPMPRQLKEIGDSNISANKLFGISPKSVFNLVASLPRTLRYKRELNKHLESFMPDIICSNGFKFHLLTGLSKYKQSKIVWHARDYLSNRHLMRKLIPLICNIPDVIITNSQSVKDDWINFIPHACYQVMHNTVSIPNPFECSKNNEGLFNGFENNRIRVGLVASYAKWKGHIVYLKAIAILVNDPRMIDCNFYVIGGPIYGTQGSQWSLEELEDKCRVLGIKERVFFIPHQESINFIYRNLDIIIHASTKPEPFGRTIIEGMAHGKAIVAARGGGVDEIITDGSDALGFDSGNEKDLAHNIKSLVVDEKLRNRLGDAGKEKVTSYFSTETGSRKVISLFENIARKQP